MHNCVCVKNEYAETLKNKPVFEHAAIGFWENIIYLMHLKSLYWVFLPKNIQWWKKNVQSEVREC